MKLQNETLAFLGWRLREAEIKLEDYGRALETARQSVQIAESRYNETEVIRDELKKLITAGAS